MAESTQSKSSGGCLSKLLLIFLLVAAGGLVAAIASAIQPQDLTDLGGYTPSAEPSPEVEMKAILKNSIDRGYPVTLSEAKINQWLGRTLVTKQGGFLGEKITLNRVWVRLEDGRAEVIMDRSFSGHRFTVSMYLQVDRMEGPNGAVTEVKLHGGPYHPDVPNPPRGGRFGKLVVPQGFLLLVMPAYEKLVAAFPDELKLGFSEMARIRIEKGKLILDPREPLGVEGMPQTF